MGCAKVGGDRRNVFYSFLFLPGTVEAQVIVKEEREVTVGLSIRSGGA